MPYLADTSILIRLANHLDPQFATADRAMAKLQKRGEEVIVVPQNLIEFRAAATRPVAVNGLGLSAAEADAMTARFGARFRLVPETPDVYPTWKGIVSALGVIGKTVHDAKLVAACHVHGIDAVLTFNVNHFTRLTAVGPPVAVVHPVSV